ncbi:MAG: AI-2E family transporter [Lentisphaerae bacterium]|nr:AI-2E family transporter [Lentisphaerota bacterium]
MNSAEPERGRPPRKLRWAVPAAAAVLILAAAVLLRRVLTPVLVAFILAYLADPALGWLERHGLRRGIATALLYAVCLAALAAAAVFLGPRIGRQTRRLYREAAGLARDYGSGMLDAEATEAAAGSAAENARPGQAAGDADGAPPGGPWAQRAREYVARNADRVASRVAALAVAVARNAARGLSNAANIALGVILVLIFTFFFMLHFRDLVAAVDACIPAAYRARTRDIVRRADRAVSNFFRGRLLICLVAGVVYVAGLRLSGIDFWLLIGVAGGVLSFVPILGVVLPLIPAGAFALLTEHPWASVAGVLLTFGAVQWVVEPLAGTLILSREVRMHPALILLALLIGGALAGAFGLLLAVPAAAVLRILWREFVMPPLRDMAEGRGGA